MLCYYCRCFESTIARAARNHSGGAGARRTGPVSGRRRPSPAPRRSGARGASQTRGRRRRPHYVCFLMCCYVVVALFMFYVAMFVDMLCLFVGGGRVAGLPGRGHGELRAPGGRVASLWLRTNGVNTSGAAAKVMNFDRLGKKVRPGTLEIKVG